MSENPYCRVLKAERLPNAAIARMAGGFAADGTG